MGNSSLGSAKSAKNDEFYTQISDIEKEMKYYEQHFKNKHIFCNCDDPEWSNFWRYFVLNFHRLGLKQLTSTHYEDGIPSYRMDMFKDVPENFKDKQTFMTLEETGIELPLGYITPLEDDGDFRSDESIRILEESDIVVTNPPFSLFSEYVTKLIDFKKGFIILGNMNAVTYKDIFPLFRDNKIWLGVTRTGTGSMWFIVPDNSPAKTGQKVIDGIRLQTIGNSAWFTNLDHSKRHEELILYKKYSEDDYPNYDNYKAIESGKVVDIPLDYYGPIGVPITFLGKYNPDQFEIIGASESEGRGFSNGLWIEESKVSQPLINGKRKFKRLFIRRKNVENGGTQ